MRRILAQTRFETMAVLRNGEQLLLTIALPLVAVVVLATTELVPLPEPRPAAALGGALAMSVAATAFTSQAIAIAFDRRGGVLRMLGTTPLGPQGLLAGKLGAVLCVLAVQAVLLGAAAAVSGWRPEGIGFAHVLGGLALVLLGAVTFVSFALVVGGTLRPEAVLAIANLLFALMVLGGGLLMPLGLLPEPLGVVMGYLPPGALGESLRSLATTGLVDLTALVVLAGWALVGVLLAGRYFRWDE